MRNLNGAGSGTFDLFAAMLVAMLLRIVAFVVTLALLAPPASPAAILQAIVLLVLIGACTAFLAIPTFGFSILAFGLGAYYVFFVLADGGGATEAILASARMAARNVPATFVLAIVPVATAVAADAGVRTLHLHDWATLAGWLVMEIVLMWSVLRASLLWEARLHT